MLTEIHSVKTLIFKPNFRLENYYEVKLKNHKMLRLSRFSKGVRNMGSFSENHIKSIQQNSKNQKTRPKSQRMQFYGQQNKVVFASGNDQEKLKSNKDWQILIARTQLGNYSLYLRDFSEKSIRYPFYRVVLQKYHENGRKRL